MPGSDKKARSREAFTAVFEEQTRRFSAFELLGISSDAAAPPSPPLGADAPPTEYLIPGVETEPPGHTAILRSDRTAQALLPDSTVEGQGTDQTSERSVNLKNTDTPAHMLRSDRLGQDLGPEGKAKEQTLDPQQGQTVEGLASGQTVWPSLGQTETPVKTIKPESLRPDHHLHLQELSPASILLAPLQWAVWLVLQEASKASRLISYRTIAKQTHSTIDGVRKAVRVLEKEKLIVQKETVRTAVEQGFRVAIDPNISVRKGTLNEAKAILKRGLAIAQTTDRQGQALRPDGLRLFVCRNTNIKHTDIAALLRMPPLDWKIREQTLIQIADIHPAMTAIEFRLSLAYLIEQAKQAKELIRNPNAWVKAAFEKNGGPLVTEREIEARYEQTSSRYERQEPKQQGQGSTEEIGLLRWYLACGPKEREKIDRSAEEKAAPLLTVVAEDKRVGVIEEARLEAIREHIAKLK